MKNVYEENGFSNREEYLDDISNEMGIDRGTVGVLADLLGEDEDFDGLITSLEDIYE